MFVSYNSYNTYNSEYITVQGGCVISSYFQQISLLTGYVLAHSTPVWTGSHCCVNGGPHNDCQAKTTQQKDWRILNLNDCNWKKHPDNIKVKMTGVQTINKPWFLFDRRILDLQASDIQRQSCWEIQNPTTRMCYSSSSSSSSVLVRHKKYGCRYIEAIRDPLVLKQPYVYIWYMIYQV